MTTPHPNPVTADEAHFRLNPGALAEAHLAFRTHANDPGRKGDGLAKAIERYLEAAALPLSGTVAVKESSDEFVDRASAKFLADFEREYRARLAALQQPTPSQATSPAPIMDEVLEVLEPFVEAAAAIEANYAKPLPGSFMPATMVPLDHYRRAAALHAKLSKRAV